MKIQNQNVFFISDFHLGHVNILEYDKRPFKDMDHMHEEIIKNWNSVVGTDSIVFYLGDLYMKIPDEKVKEILNQLNGNIHYIMGNHDRFNQIKNLNRFETISDLDSVLVKDENGRGGYQQIEMCHFPLLVWNKHDKGSWHLHGHCHHSLDKSSDFYKRRVMDVGCNGIGYTPISYSQVKKIMNSKTIEQIDHHEF
jgi:calcineurin-like phosphoesterase family protein